MKKVILAACVLACGLFQADDANADTIYTYTVPVQEAYAFEDNVEEILDYLEIVHTDTAVSKGTLSQSDLTVHDNTCQECHGDNFIDNIIVTAPRTPRTPPSIPVITPPRPVIGPFIPVIDTGTPAPVTPPPPVVCTPEMDLLAQEMRAALLDGDAVLSELGGLLYRNADGTLGVSRWVRGSPATDTTNPVVDIFTAVVPEGATVIGGWHTHPTGTWDHNPVTGAYTQAGQYFSRSDLSIANPEWVGREPDGGLAYSRTQSLPGFLGLGLGLNTTHRSGLYFLRDDAIDTNVTAWNPETIMNYADDISRCGL